MRDDSAIERALRDSRYGRALRRQRDGPARRWVHCWRVRSRAWRQALYRALDLSVCVAEVEKSC